MVLEKGKIKGFVLYYTSTLFTSVSTFYIWLKTFYGKKKLK